MLIMISFYLVSTATVLAAVMVVFSRNTVHSVLWLIFVFLNVAILFVTLGAEFLAMILVIVYVGAVAVLFLFVVMMLNVAQQKNEWFSSEKNSTHIPIGLLVSLIIFLELIVVVGGWKHKPEILNSSTLVISKDITNTHLIGNILYTEYIHLFQISGMILLVAMIGAIILTFKKRDGLKRQSYLKQISRERAEGVELIKVKNKEGIKFDV